MSSRVNFRDRYSFANLDEVLDLPDLIAIQRESFRWFVEQGLADAFRDISPIKDFTETLSLELEFDPFDEDLRPPPKFTVEECKEKDMTFSAPIFARARFMNANTGEIKEQTVFMGDFPMMTDKGTFIINGTERVVVSQLVRSPGVIFQPGERFRLRNLSKHQLVTGTIHPYRGEWIEFDVEQKPGKDPTAGTRVARKRRLSLFVLLRALGYDDANAPGFLEAFVRHFDFLEGQWEKDKEIAPTQEEAIIEIYKRARPGEPATPDSARNYFNNAFFEPRRYDLSRVGRYKLNRKLGPEIERLQEQFPQLAGLLDVPDPDQPVLSRCEVLAATTYLLNLAAGTHGYRLDDQDHFANRRIRSVGELIQNQVRIGLSRMERVVRERMTTQDVEAITPTTLINIRPVVAAIKEFFGTSQLSQFMDQVNPLSGLNHRRRLSALGPGGLSRERAGFEVRDVHFSHYGRMCPIETPEGPNIGLQGALATFARVNQFGFIETPYRKVENGRVTDEIVYLPADEEEEYIVAQANTPIGPDGRFTADRVLVRRSPQAASLSDLKLQLERDEFLGATTEISAVAPEEVQLMDVSPRQIVSVGTALIPFLEHDDANRALMGANMQKQAVPLLRAEAPYIGTGMETRAARDAADMILAIEDGVVLEVDGGQIVVEYKKAGRVTHRLHKFERSNQDTCINQRPAVAEGQKLAAGDVIAEGPSTDNGELALGKNLLVAFMPWEGYNFEDAIILSERLVKDDVLTSIHIHEHEVDARDTKLGPEEITRDIPNLSEEILMDLDERGIIRVGAEVDPGDVLVGKVTPKGETELTPEERLLRAIFGEKAREVRDTSLKVPHGETGKVIDVKVFSRDDEHELPPGVNQLVRVYVAQKRKISVGDKLAGRHGNKGVISRILPIEDMPFLADGTPVDIILNPLGVPSRMNVGQVLETHLGWAARWGWDDGDEHIGETPLRGTETKTRPTTRPATLIATPVFDGAKWDEEDMAGRHPTIKTIFSNIEPESVRSDYGNDGRLIGSDGKATLYNGRTGEAYDNPVTCGYAYILKLAHLVDDKIHARSTGPYSMITQQPLGGKAQFGGQRFGEMEVWALEAYGAAYCLQELLTIKSDDTLGRVKVYEAIVKGENIPEPGIPESFKVLIKEMQALCLNVEVLSRTGEEIKMRELDEDFFRAAEELGIDLSRPERGSDEDDARRQAERR
ncbi:MAG TPA: DNA-directed RNA polymerase subunit beta [Microthrixaceae bacterium]|nr:DNA-directed RNA polymerase subunit beta [Microthrixaceae bacterium]MCO5306832.1 DNA-directed RNA polymerase subunit beta [Microthrixaceae bacterium]HMV73931.1 DNA-directed RNA polymerase subunit beta [Microthrixaceae bacterium]HMY87852.1 DNA-directed RNA polymerase subunit beta [Microthrixaceae bacterium]HNA37056.1 DNA-directed RNA polymerase subunit beta [Microthrixaceae bacterium]